MPNYTPKYNLEKPLKEEFYNVDVTNSNLTKIDTAIDTKLDKTANAVSATKLQTARTITIGNTGKTFDGSANQSWSLSEIGAAPYGYGLGATKNATAQSERGAGFWRDTSIGKSGVTLPYDGTPTINYLAVSEGGVPYVGNKTGDTTVPINWEEIPTLEKANSTYLKKAGDTSTGAQRIRQQAGVYNETGFYIDATNAEYPRLEIFKYEPTAGKPDFYIRRRINDMTLLDLIKCTHAGLVSYAGGTFNGDITAPNIITNASVGTCTTLFSGTQQCGQNTWKDTGIDIPTKYSSVLIGVNHASSGIYDTESEFSRCTLTRGQTLLFSHQAQNERIMGKIIGDRLWTFTSAGVMTDNNLKTVIGITRR